jgi:hypothetical protein
MQATPSKAAADAPAASPPPAAKHALAETAAWVDRAVLGLGLCPFAKAPRQQSRIRFVHSAAEDIEALLGAFCDEASRLMSVPPSEIETTLLVHPRVLGEFDDYNDFLDLADAALDAIGATGVLQVASFHPRYRFAGTDADDIANATNRSPWPTLQLLRETSVATAALAFPDGAQIYSANIATLRALGPAGWAALQAACRRDADEPGAVEPDPG